MMNEENIVKVTIDESGKDLRVHFVKAMSFAHARRIAWNGLLNESERANHPTIECELACERSDS